jgi:hypothetical protein
MILEPEGFSQLVTTCNQKITQLPAGEIKYYLYILVNSVKNKNTGKNAELLNKTLTIIDNIQIVLQPEPEQALDTLYKLWGSYKQLQNIAQTHTYNNQIKNAVINIGSCLTAVLLGMAGGLIGGVAGFIRGAWNLEPLKGLGIGMLTGYLMGSILGFRGPQKLFENELRQIKYGLDSINQSLGHLQKSVQSNDQAIKPFSVYLATEKENMRQLHFNNDPTEFSQFLKNEATFSICAYKATFLEGDTLTGYVGNHTYMLIKIKESSYLIEFNNTAADLSRPVEQEEKRIVTGEKIIEMLAFHRKLQETNACTIRYVLTQMKAGENDCVAYINKTLTGTSQKATTLKRFANMNYVGGTIGFFIEKLSILEPEFFHTIDPGV